MLSAGLLAACNRKFWPFLASAAASPCLQSLVQRIVFSGYNGCVEGPLMMLPCLCQDVSRSLHHV